MKVETQTLWDEFRETGDVEIRNRLVEKYLYIVKYVADRLQQRLPRSIRNEDLRSAASQRAGNYRKSFTAWPRSWSTPGCRVRRCTTTRRWD